MGQPWAITARSAAAGNAASANLTAPAQAAGASTQIRLQALQVTLAGTTAGQDQVQVLDGATVIWQADLSVPANGNCVLAISGLDLRATPGNTLTIKTINGVGSDYEDVNAQGDYVPQGYPYHMP
jgi:hypothetical protein